MSTQRAFGRVWLVGMVVGVALLSFGHGNRALAALAVEEFTVKDHRNGNAQPPQYILRLDGLTSRDADDEFTFSVDSALIPLSALSEVGVSLFYTFNDTTLDPFSIRIAGTVYGGRDVGVDWESGSGAITGLWDLDFTYSADITAAVGGPGIARDDLEVSDLSLPNGTGTISPRFDISGEVIPKVLAGQTIDLNDYAGKHSYSFRFNDSEGHRLGAGGSDAPAEGLFVGYGWVNHGNSDVHLAAHLKSSDWLFEAMRTPDRGPPLVPEPSSLIIWSLLGLAFAVAGWRRNHRGK